MPVELVCTACAARLRVPGFTPGRAVRCPKCATVFVPAAPVAEPSEPPVAEPVPEPPAPPPPPAPAPAANPFDFDKKPEPQRTSAATKNAKIVGAPNSKNPPRAQPVAPKTRPRDDDAAAPAPKAKAPDKSKDQPKPANKKREREKEPRPINPAVLVGGLAFLALGAAIIAGVLIFGGRDDDRAKRDPVPVNKDKIDPPKPPEPDPQPKPPEPEPKPPEPEPEPKPKVDERFKPPLFPALNPPGPAGPDPEPEPDPEPKVEPKPPEPKPKRPLFPPVVAVPFAPSDARDRLDLDLPGPVSDACVGGGGRFWCLLIPSTKQVGVYDVSARALRYVALAEQNALIAASMNKLVLAYPDTGALTRVDLVTLARERTVQTDLRGFTCALMGSASAGPLWIGPRALDLSDFEPVADNGPFPGVLEKYTDYRIAPDGRSYARTGKGERAVQNESAVASLDPTRARPNVGNGLAGAGYLVPGADGLIYTGRGVFTPDGTELGAPSAGAHGNCLRVPAEEGDYYLAGTGGGGRTFSAVQAPKLALVYRGGDRRALLALPDVDLPLADPNPFPNTTFDRFTCDKRVLFTVRGKAIAVLPHKGNKLIVYPCDVEGELARRGADHLLFTSRPPAPVPGEAFRYAVKVSAKRAPVSFALDAGPPGATVSPEGVVTWQVPAPFDRPVSMRVLATDASGQLAAHEFSLLTDAGTSPPLAVLGERAPAAKAEPYTRPGARGAVVPAEVPVPLPLATVADGAVLKLPGAADWTGFGGGGRFAVFRVPDAREVIAVDLCKGHTVVRAPLAEPDALVAAGNTYLFVLARRANTIQRWNLLTGKLEATAANPVHGTPHQLLLGHATNGPLLVAGPDRALDPVTFEPVPFASGKQMPADLGSWTTVWKDDRVLSMSPDGQLLAWWSPRYSPTGVTARRAGASPADAKATNLHETHGPVRAGPDGIVFTADGPYTPELKPLEPRPHALSNYCAAPAAHGPFFVDVSPLPVGAAAGPRAVTLRALGRTGPLLDLSGPLLDLTGYAGFDLPDHFGYLKARLQLYDRTFLVPEARVLAVLTPDGDALHFHALDPEALLRKAKQPHLYVVGAPEAAVRGTTFAYKPTVRAAGPVKVEIEDGPDGMVVAPDGTVVWGVPRAFAEPSVRVTVRATCGDRVALQTFVLPVVRERAKLTEAPPAPNALRAVAANGVAPRPRARDSAVEIKGPTEPNYPDAATERAIRTAGGTVRRSADLPNNPIVFVSFRLGTLADADVARFADLPHLRELDLSHCKGTFTAPALAKLKGLKVLHLRGCVRLGDRGASALAGIEGLEELDLSGTDVLGRVPGTFDGFKKLRVLRLAGTSGNSRDLVAAVKGLPALEVLDLSANNGQSRAFAFEPMPNLRELVLARRDLNRAALDALLKCEKLEALDLSYGNDIGAAGIEALGGLPKLRKLRLEESAAAVAANAKAFGKLTHLTHLTVWIADTTTGGELELPAMPGLVELNLYQHRVSDKTLAPLLGPKLQVLSLAGANVTDATLAALEKCPDLRKLTLSYTAATERGLEVLARLKKLEEVELAATFELGAPTGRALAGLPGLRRLTVRGRAVATADAFWAELRTAPKLAHLTVRGGGSANALREIAALPALEVLEIPGTALDRVDLRALAAAKGLRRLDLSYAGGLTAEIGPELAALTSVRELVIANTLSGDPRGRDNLVPFLVRLPGLKFLNIDQTGITAEGQRKLKERLPGCTVVYESVWDQWKNP